MGMTPVDGPGDRAERMLAYGLELGPPCKEAVERYGKLIKGRGLWNRLTRMPQWERVELLLGLYECAHWKVELPEGDEVERALWYVAREMNCFHKNVLEG